VLYEDGTVLAVDKPVGCYCEVPPPYSSCILVHHLARNNPPAAETF
jgi:23S rRNA-/tRNA-specific pseudouridylate synthase